MSAAETFSIPDGYVVDVLELAMKYKKQVRMAYVDKKGNPEFRTVEPFEFLHGKQKTFVSHCLLRESYRYFNVDRVVRIALSDVDRTHEPPEKADS